MTHHKEHKVHLKIHHKKKKDIHEELEETSRKVEEVKKHAKGVMDDYLPYKKKKARRPKEDDVARIKTGIDGLDELIEGGFPDNSVILLTGTCGTGKSMFAMNFLVYGAMHDEPGVYVSLEESMDETVREMKAFGWPVEDLIKSNKLLIVQPEMYNFDALMTTIEDAVDKIHAKRLVIDSASIIGMYFENEFKVRKSLLELSRMLKKLGCTTIAISEIREGSISLSPYGVEEYVVDGVVVLHYLKKGNMFIRAVSIRKMRSTRHSSKIHPIEIREVGGVIVYPSEQLFD